MYVKKNYGFLMTFNWSKKPFIIGAAYSLALCLFQKYIEVSLAIPWQPISIIGIGVAFYLGFKNNSSYDRTWEARKIWGGIVNASRTFGSAVNSFVVGPQESEIRKELIYRHIAWLTALRHQLRLSRTWEHTDMRLNKLYFPTICEDYNNKLESELQHYISQKEIEQIIKKANVATQILAIQSQRLQDLRNQGYFEDFRHMEMHQLVARLYDEQGKSERIKNFPFPRQYASTALWLTFVFAAFVPFGLMDTFSDNSWKSIALCSSLSALITWIFFLMEKIGDYSENPFEGSYNDVPITSISRAIEIDLRQMIDDQDIPQPVETVNGFLM